MTVFFSLFLTDSSVLSWNFWPKRRREKVTEMIPIRRCMDMEVNQVDLMLKPFEPSVCCDPCGWSQEYPVSRENCWAPHTNTNATNVNPVQPNTLDLPHWICCITVVVLLQVKLGLHMTSPDGLCAIPQDGFSKTSIYMSTLESWALGATDSE